MKADGTRIAIFKPDSIGFMKLPPDKASAVMEAVEEIVRVETGLGFDGTDGLIAARASYADGLRERSAAIAS